MKPSEVAARLKRPELLNDLTYPRDRDAAILASEYVLDAAELQFAVELYLEAPDELRRSLMAGCVDRMKARAAA